MQDPILGRFISADPLIQAPCTQSHNRYSYVWNNPASFIDPSGFECTPADMSGCSEQDMNNIYTWLTDQIMCWQSGEGAEVAAIAGVDAGMMAFLFFNGISDIMGAFTRDNPVATGRVATHSDIFRGGSTPFPRTVESSDIAAPAAVRGTASQLLS